MSELNEETVDLISGHCLVHSFKMAKIDNEIVDAPKRMIAKTNFKVPKLEELASFFNLKINLKYYNINEYFDETSNIHSISSPKNSQSKNGYQTVNLVVILEHFMIDEILFIMKTKSKSKRQLTISRQQIPKRPIIITKDDTYLRHSNLLIIITSNSLRWIPFQRIRYLKC